MKGNLSRMLRSAVALLLVFCMVAGFVPTTVFAQETTKKVVSLGDSMTNGLGLGGGYDSTGHQGFMEIDKYSYPALIAEHYGWELTQLATSCMRVEDLHYILEVGTENAYPGDEWTQRDLLNNARWYLGAEGTAEVFQTAVAEADVILMAAGDCNLGVYLMDMVVTALGMTGYGYDYSFATVENALAIVSADEEMRELVLGICDELQAYLSEFLPEDLVDTLVDRMTYVVANFIIHYAGALERMVELNPDVEMIIIGLMNTMSGYEMDIISEGVTYHLDFAEMLDLLLDPLNVYLAGRPATKQMIGHYPDATFYYAELDRIQTLAMTYTEEYAENEAFYLDRFVGEISSLMGMPWLTAEMILAYRTAVRGAETEEEKAAAVAGFIAQMGVDQETGMNLVMAVEAYNVFEAYLLNSVNQKPTINLDEGIYDENGDMREGFTIALMGLYTRLALANGMSAHPSKNAHRDMYETIVAAYGNHTAMDETMDNAMEAAKIIGGLVVEYYDDVYAAFQQTQTYWDATHTYNLPDAYGYYVAIGDGTVMSESYADMLAQDLGASFKNLAVNGMLIADTYELLEKNKAEIEKADLITLGFGANSFVNFAVDNVGAGIFTGKFAELDWASVVGEENVPLVKEAMASVYEEMAAKGMGTLEIWGMSLDMAQLMTVALESFAYAAASYAVELPRVVDAINEMNENATVVIVGMHNPMKGVSLVMGEDSLDLGAYLDYLVEVANLRNLAYAVQTAGATFVEAKEVETQNTKKELEALEFLLLYMYETEDPKSEFAIPSEAGHTYIKTQIENALVEVNPVEVELSRMILGNELALQFAFKQEPFVEEASYTAVITKKVAGKEDKVVEIPQSEWKSMNINGEPYYYVSFNGIAAKEMGDDVNVQIFVGDLEVSEVYTDSIRSYAVRQLRKTDKAVTKTLYVDMLNYGAAAQTYFGYDAQNLANAELTAQEQGYATKEVKLNNKLMAGTNYAASQLNLASSIQLRVKFNNIDASMNAVVTFTNHTGNKVEAQIPGSEFLGNGTVVVVDEIVAADYAQDVTIVVYDAAGNKVAEAVDSVASYLARKSGASAAIFDAVAKYTASAYAYLHQ